MPEPGSDAIRPRLIIDVVVEGLDIAPQACLLDSGATAIRFGAFVADLCGIDLSGAPRTRLAVGGAVVDAALAEVGLLVSDGQDSHSWIAPVWFCEPWTPSFGLLRDRARGAARRWGEARVDVLARKVAWPLGKIALRLPGAPHRRRAVPRSGHPIVPPAS